MTVDIEMSDNKCRNVTWTPVASLSRRIGQRYGFASVGISRSDFALLGGVVHFELSHSQSKGDIERGNPVPFSQVHIVGHIRGNSASSPFKCSLLSITPAADLPCPRLYHSANSLTSSNSVVVFGGQAFSDKRKLGDIWQLGLSTDSEGELSGEWKELAPASRSSAFPPPRSMHATSSYGNTLIVSGGSGFEDTVLGDMWVAHVADNQVLWNRVNSPIGKVPCPRRSHALSPMVSEIELMLFGGIDASGNCLSDMWMCQFVNEEKTRCVWTELVSCPLPRAGHIVFPSFGVDEAKGNRSMMVFGGNQSNACRYNIDNGSWSCSSAITDDQISASTNFIAVGIDALYTAKEDEGKSEQQIFEIPSVLMIPDTVLRTSPCSPWLGSIYAVDMEEGKSEDDESKEIEPKIKEEAPSPVLTEAERSLRRSEYRILSNQLPSLPPGPTDDITSTAIMSTTNQSNQENHVQMNPSSGLFVISNLVSGIWQQNEEDPTIFPKHSASSWSSGSSKNCHVLVTGAEFPASFSSLESFRDFINTPSTVRAVTETCNSCLVVVNGEKGDKFIGYICPSLLRHSGGQPDIFASPVVSTVSSPYAEIQATLRLIQLYSPFRSPAAIDELFALFRNATAGILLIDFDGRSDNKAPNTASHNKPSLIKDPTQFWSEVLACVKFPRPFVEQYALTYLRATPVSVNGGNPAHDFYSTLKSKLLQSPLEAKIPGIGSILIGKVKTGSNIGVLVYANGVIIRHIRGRFPFSEESEEDMESFVNQVTAVVDVGAEFTPLAGAWSDFLEAAVQGQEWANFVTRIDQICAAFAQKGTLN